MCVFFCEDIPSLVVYDIPGLGTPAFPKETFFVDFPASFDLYLVVTAHRSKTLEEKHKCLVMLCVCSS